MAYGPVAYARNGLSAYGLCAMFLACACGPMATAKAYGPMAYGPVTAAQPKATGPEIAACCVSLRHPAEACFFPRFLWALITYCGASAHVPCASGLV